MCYKLELQRRNKKTLESRLKEVPDFVQDFLFNNLKSEASKINYLNTIILFFEWCIENNFIKRERTCDVVGDDLNLKTIVFTRYFLDLQDGGIKDSTLETKIKQLKSFFKYLSYNDYIVKDYIQGISKAVFKFEKNQQLKEEKLPTREEVNMLLRNVRKNKRQHDRVRNVAIIETFINTGLRVSELVGLDVDSLYLDEEKPYLLVVGKGYFKKDNSQKVYLNKKIVEILKQWLVDRQLFFENIFDENNEDVHENQERKIDKDALFLTTTGKRITENGIRKIIEKNSDNKITPHMLRHFYATKLLKETKNIVYVKDQLRHSSVNLTAEVYANGELN